MRLDEIEWGEWFTKEKIAFWLIVLLMLLGFVKYAVEKW